jgi:hypothetical protein
MPAFSLLLPPHVLAVVLPREQNAPLPLVLRQARSFGARLEPRYIIRAGAFDQ